MLIGLVGQKGVGKDCFADYLMEHYDFTKTHFADPLKEGIRHIFDLNDEQLYGSQKEVFDKRWGKSPRELFQIFGTDIMRNIMSPLLGLGNNIWVHRFQVWYENNKTKNVAIADIRFPSEADSIRKLGGILVKLKNNKKSEDYHISEQLIDEIDTDYLIENIGTKEEYYQKIKHLMETLTKEDKKQS